MERRNAPARGWRVAALVASLSTLIALAVVLAQPDSRDVATRSVGADGTSGTAHDVSPPVGLAARSAAGEAVPLQSGTLPRTSTVPESYRRACGGITGRLVEDGGQPVQDTRIVLVGGSTLVLRPPPFVPRDDLMAGTEFVLREARTAPDGRFVVEALGTDAHLVLLVDPAGPRATWRNIDALPPSGRVQDLGDVVLPPVVTIGGRVVDASGRSVAGARVRWGIDEAVPALADLRAGGALAFGSPESGLFTLSAQVEGLLPIVTTWTAADGSFGLSAPAGTSGVVLVDHPDHPPVASTRLTTGGTSVALDTLTLAPGLQARGRVVDASGSPVAGLLVHVGSAGSTVAFRPAVSTDGEGRFTVGGLGPRSVAAVLRRAGDLPLAVHEFATTEPALIELPAPVEMVVRIVDELDRPLPGIVVHGHLSNNDDEPPSSLMPMAELTPLMRDLGDGQHALPVGRDDGTWALDVTAQGRERIHRVVRARDSLHPHYRAGHRSFVLRPARDVAIRVTDAHDRPVEWALVTAWSSDDHAVRLSNARTDAAGRAVVGHVPGERVGVEVFHPAWASAFGEHALPDPGGELLVRLVEGGVVEGNVLRDGEPVLEPMQVSLHARDPSHPALDVRRTTLAREGRFRFDGVQPGAGVLELRPPSTASSEPFLAGRFTSPWTTAPVEVVAGGRHEVSLRLGGDGATLLRGRLLVNGRPGAGWIVTTGSQQPVQTRAGPGGEFELPLPSARQALVAHPPGTDPVPWRDTSTARLFVTAAEAQAGVLTWTLSTATLLVELLGDDGRPPADGGMASLVPHDGLASRRLQPVSGGRIAFGDVAVGRYDVVYGDHRARNVEVPTSGVVTLRLGRPIEVRGRITLPKGLELGDARAQATSADGGAPLWLSTTTGEFGPLRLVPGTWTFRVRLSGGESLSPLTVTLEDDVDDLQLSFERGEDPDPAPWLPETLGPEPGTQEHLEELGYL